MQSETHDHANGTSGTADANGPCPHPDAAPLTTPRNMTVRVQNRRRSLDTDDPNGPRLSFFLLAAHKAARRFRRTLKQPHHCIACKTSCGSCGHTHVERCNFCDMKRAVEMMLNMEPTLLDHHEAIDMNIMDERAIYTRHAAVIRRLERALDRIIARETARHEREVAKDNQKRNIKIT